MNILKYFAEKTKNRKVLVTIMAAIVVFITTYALILPAIALDEDTAQAQGGIELSADQDAEAAPDDENTDGTDTDVVKPDGEDSGSADSDITDDGDAAVEPEKTKAAKATSISDSGEAYEVTVTYGEEAGVPEDASLKVAEITDNSDQYDKLMARTEDALGEDAVVAFARFFDIKIVDKNGDKVKIEAPVDVKIELKDKKEDQDTQVVHFADSRKKGDVIENVEIEEASKKKGEDFTLVFAAESFSVYAIVDGPQSVPEGWYRIKNLDDLKAHANDGLYIGSSAKNMYFKNTEVTTTEDGVDTVGIERTMPAKNSPPTEPSADTSYPASKFYFEQVSGSNNQFYVYCYGENDQKQYVYNNGNDKNLSFIDESNRTKFTFAVDSSRVWTMKNGSWYWSWDSASGATRFVANKSNNNNNKMYIWYKIPEGKDTYGLDGKTYALLTWDGNTTAKALTGEKNQDYQKNLCADFLTVMTHKSSGTSGLPSKLYVPSNTSDDTTHWTFNWVDENNYKLSGSVPIRDGEGKITGYTTKYLKINRDGSLDTTASESEADVIQVSAGTGIHAGQIILKANGKTLTYSGKFAQGFNTGNTGYEYLYLADFENADIVSEYYQTFSARKISVSDDSLTPQSEDAEPAKVIIYTRAWNGSGYTYFAVDGNGELVPIAETGDNIEWIGSGLNELQWEFTEYGTWKDGTFTPNKYYELRNEYTGKYLAPLQAGQTYPAQILSDNTIGLNMPGRTNGQYYTPFLTWDAKKYAYTSITVDLDNGAVIEPCYRAQGMDFYFAIINEVDKDDTIHTVPTVDNNQYGIKMKIVDFGPDSADYPSDKQINGDGCTTSQKQTDVLRNNKYISQKTHAGLLSTDLKENGYPTATLSNSSLQELYSKAHEVNHLFIESTYKATGYYQYDSAQNYAYLTNTGDFRVYQELGTYDDAIKDSLKHGQFFPYNDIQAGVYADPAKNGLNKFTPTLARIPESDPRYEELMYKVTNPNKYFGLELEASFIQTPSGLDAWGHDIIFEFSGDDDFWLYVDGELVIDLGGIHSALAGSVNFRTGEVIVNKEKHQLSDLFRDNYLKRTGDPSAAQSYVEGLFETKYDEELGKEVTVFKDGSPHTMRIFYMERGAGASNLQMKFNLASVKKGTVQMSKALTEGEGEDRTDISEDSIAVYPYQIWYEDPLYDPDDSSHNEKYVQLTDQTLGNRGSVKYKDSTKDVDYSRSITVDNTVTDPDTNKDITYRASYNDVYFIKPGETIEITFPVFGETGKEKYVEKYKVVECGVDPRVYNSITVNGNDVPISESAKMTKQYVDEHGDVQTLDEAVDSGLKDYAINYTSMDNLAKVSYDNNVEKTEKMTIQKELYKKEGAQAEKIELYDENGEAIDPDDPDLNTTFDFRLSFKNPYQEDFSPANVYYYHVKDPAGYYCKWLPADEDEGNQNPNAEGSDGRFVRITNETHPGGVDDFDELTDDRHEGSVFIRGEKSEATFDTSMNGAISQIPAYYTVEICGLLPGTKFNVVERPTETPDGYKFWQYLLDGTVYDVVWDGVTGTIKADEGSEDVIVRNYKGYALRLHKNWADASTIRDRDPSYFAVYYEYTDSDGHKQQKLIEDSVRKLEYSAKPQELYWLYLNLPKLEDVDNPLFANFYVREVQLDGNFIVDNDGVVTGYTSIKPVANGGIITLHGKAVGEIFSKEINYKVTYAEPVMTNNLRKFTVTNTPSGRPAVKIYKTDWSGNPLKDAKFTLKHGSEVIFENKASKASGLVETVHVSENTNYDLSETLAPQTYYGLPEDLSFKLVTDEAAGWTLDVTPKTEDIKDYYIVGKETVTEDDGTETEFVTLTIKNRPYEFKAIKLYGTDPLEGVKFNLWKQKKVGENISWDIVKWDGVSDLVTDANGIIPRIDNLLPAGTYELRETPLPNYARIKNIDFTVSETGLIKLTNTDPLKGVKFTGPTPGNASAGEDPDTMYYKLKIQNQLATKLRVIKVDQENKPLVGAGFNLTPPFGEAKTYTSTLDTELNQAVIYTNDDLQAGEYKLEETGVPEGFLPLEGKVVITATEGNNGLEVSAKINGQTMGANDVYQDGTTWVVRIRNNAGVELPSTGGPGTTLIYVLGGLMVLLAGAGLFTRRRKLM